MTGNNNPGPAGRKPDRKNWAILVDGYVRDLFTTGMILQRLDYDVHIVNTGEDAVKIMDAALPVLIITELALPKMSGLELLIRVKHDSRTKALPVIIHTSDDDVQRKELCRASGCAAFLKKPVEPDALFSTIQQATNSTPRQFIRLRTLLPVMVAGNPGSGNVFSTEYVSELSENGIFVRTLTPRPVNAVVSVTIMVRSIPVKLKAVVMHSVALKPGLFREPGMGMKFVEISPTDRELLKNIIKGQILKDIPAQ